MFCEIQIQHDGAWLPIARFTPFRNQIPLGYAGCGGHLEYDEEYVVAHFQPGSTLPAVSLPLPIGFIIDKHDRWPAFLLDLLPTGAGRKGWLDRLDLRDTPAADWQLLTHGARHPVGWLRIVGAESEMGQMSPGPGFTRQDVALREQAFLEYALSLGASVAGSSDVQGESPKLLLTEDKDGLLHADGAVADSAAGCHWLVKFARGRDERERQILRNEGGYLKLADLLGSAVHKADAVALEKGTALFIPRFDRACHDGRVERFGLESFASAAGIAEFGVKATHQENCCLILKYSTSPTDDLLEYLRRDVLNICLGNTDNHLRNHAFLKRRTGEVRLSPFFDVAPMFLSPDGIARVCRWGNDLERMAQPDWGAVGNYVARLNSGPGADRIAQLFHELSELFGRFALLADEAGLDREVVTLRTRVVDENRKLLDRGADEVRHET
jgi:serine/threonine-protein kinase HipA